MFPYSLPEIAGWRICQAQSLLSTIQGIYKAKAFGEN